MKSIALTLLLFCCLLAAVYATPGQVVINGKCIDCNRPDGDNSVIIPPDNRKSAAVNRALTSGAIGFGLVYYFISVFLRN